MAHVEDPCYAETPVQGERWRLWLLTAQGPSCGGTGVASVFPRRVAREEELKLALSVGLWLPLTDREVQERRGAERLYQGR